MRTYSRARVFGLISFSATALLAALCAGAQIAGPPATARATAQAWDSVAQARFLRVKPGKFGEHALFGLAGQAPTSGPVDPLDGETPEERARLAPAIQSGRVVIVGILHCRFKPSRDVALDKSTRAGVFHPSTEAIQCVAASQDVACHRLAWAKARLDSAALPALPFAVRNEPYNSRYAGYLVAVRPVTAHAPICLTCHHGAKLGDTLGALVYLVSEKRAHTPSRFLQRQLNP